MKTVFTQNCIVIGSATTPANDVMPSSGIAGTINYALQDGSPVDIGWTVALVGGQPVFTPPVAYPLLTPMTLYMAFTPAERIAIKASKDPLVIEFWDMFQLSVQLNKPTDPNLVSVQEALAYLAIPASPGPGGGILASSERVQQILAGTPQ